MNPVTLLELITDLYSQVQALSTENKQLREILEAKETHD